MGSFRERNETANGDFGRCCSGPIFNFKSGHFVASHHCRIFTRTRHSRVENRTQPFSFMIHVPGWVKNIFGLLKTVHFFCIFYSTKQCPNDWATTPRLFVPFFDLSDLIFDVFRRPVCQGNWFHQLQLLVGVTRRNPAGNTWNLVDKVHYYAFLKINFAGVYSGKGAEWQ